MRAIQHTAHIQWKRQGPGFTRGHYSREHIWTFDGGMTIAASPSPHIVPSPWSNPAHVDPEEALVAAISSCHMLTFLWLASKENFQADQYDDHASGSMTRNPDGKWWVSRVELHPVITWSGDQKPTTDDIHRLHEAAHEECFIARSVKTEIAVIHG